MLVSIETSCDETAVSIFDIKNYLNKSLAAKEAIKAELVSSQVKLHREYGGVVPELASREHLKNLPIIFEQALIEAGITKKEIELVSVTTGPGLKGCLLVGYSFAKALAKSLEVPFLGINHIEGHIFAASLVEEVKFPMLTLVVSGGHTELVYAKGFRDYQIISRTRDDAAGEAFDKTATLLGLPYPGGPELSKLAEHGDSLAFDFPIALRKEEKSFSFSGLKTAVLRKVTELKDELASDEKVKADLAASIQRAIVEALLGKTKLAIDKLKPKQLILTGGVAANRQLRKKLQELATEEKLQLSVPPPKWCTDNASMIAVLTAELARQKGFSNAVEDNKYKLAARWTVEEIK